jgi:hypothetical protein
MFMAHCLIGTLEYPYLFWLRCLILPLCCNLIGFGRINTLGAYLISPEMGSHFIMYLANLKGLIMFHYTEFIIFTLC